MNDTAAWLKDFERRAGRPLRVLHIGNIANNAYNNAKIQRAAGIDADVLSFDYYHIMACPEWEDADFTGDVGDDMFPDWWAADLQGFERPRWFAQGPLDACIRHLFEQVGRPEPNAFWWRMLEFERWLVCRKSLPSRILPPMIALLTGSKVARPGHPFNAAAAGWLARLIRRVTENSLFAPIFAGGPLHRLGLRLSRLAQAAFMPGDIPRHMRALAKRSKQLLPRAQALLAPIGQHLKDDDLDWAAIWWWHPYMRRLLSRYDVVQAYATYTTIPLLAGREDYVAYEHGTIRAIPFEDNMQGRVCATTYRAASAVLVTNSDNIDATRRLQLDPEKVVWLPHAFDSGKLLRFAADYRSRVSPPERGLTVFFSPSRQDWLRHDPSLSKGNDRLIRALATVVSRGHDCRVELVEWGSDLEASRKLIADLGLAGRVTWLPKMKKRGLWAKYLDVDCVVDQFVVPAMGGVTFEAMMLGRRVISAIDERQAQEFFGESPPLFNAATAEEIAAAMISVILDRGDRSGRGQANQDWMRKYHSQERIVALQAGVYRRVLDPDPAGRGAPSADRARQSAPPKARMAFEILLFLLLTPPLFVLAQLLFLPTRIRRWIVEFKFAAAVFLKQTLPEAWWLVLRDTFRAVKQKARAGWTMALWPARFSILLYRYRRAARPRATPGSLSGWPRHVVMLVVSDLRIDPRVERAARVLVGAG